MAVSRNSASFLLDLSALFFVGSFPGGLTLHVDKVHPGRLGILSPLEPTIPASLLIVRIKIWLEL